MAKYIKPDQIEVLQSVGPFTSGDPNSSERLQVFEPEQGRDLVYLNPLNNSGSTEIVEEHDKRIPLGTYTLNNRDYWENNNFNESTFKPYLTDNLETLITRPIPTPDGEIVDVAIGFSSNDLNWSVDALPFVINPNNDEIIHLDRYYDRNIDKENYELATEGKINYYLQLRGGGRITGSFYDIEFPHTTTAIQRTNIDIFSERNVRSKTNSITGFGPNFFDYYVDKETERGFYLFKLNWGDGTEIEYTDEPKLLESTVIFEHYYEKPGFYSITGIVYQYTGDTHGIRQYEKFQTNILLNPSSNYEINLYDYDNFASLGGLSKNSAFVKSLYSIIGINPINGNTDRASLEVIEKLNELDKLQILNILSKLGYGKVKEKFMELLSPYQTPTDNESSEIFGCMEEFRDGVEAINYNPLATYDDGSCIYTYDFNVTTIGNNGNLLSGFETYDGQVRNDLNILDFVIIEGTGPQNNFSDVVITVTFETTIFESVSNGNPEQLVFEGFQRSNGDIVELELISEQTLGEPLEDQTLVRIYQLDSISNSYNLFAKYNVVDLTPPLVVTNLQTQVYPGPNPSVPTVDFDTIELSFNAPTDEPGDLSHFVILKYEVIEDALINTDNITIDYVGDEQTYYYLDTELEQKDYTYRIYSVDDNEHISEDYAEVGPIMPITDALPEDFLIGYAAEINLNEDNEELPFVALPFDFVAEDQLGFEDGFGKYEIKKVNVRALTETTIDVTERRTIDPTTDTEDEFYNIYRDYDIETDTLYEYSIRAYDANGNHCDYHNPRTFDVTFSSPASQYEIEFYEAEGDRPPGVLYGFGPVEYHSFGINIGDDEISLFAGFQIQKRRIEHNGYGYQDWEDLTWVWEHPFNAFPMPNAFDDDLLDFKYLGIDEEGFHNYPGIREKGMHAFQDQYPNTGLSNYELGGKDYFIKNSFFDDGTLGEIGLDPGAQYQYRVRVVEFADELEEAYNSPDDRVWSDLPHAIIELPEDTTVPIITYGDDKTLQSAIPLDEGGKVELTIRTGPPNGLFGDYDYDYYQLAVRPPGGSMGFDQLDAVYFNGQDYTNLESYITIPAPDGLVEGDTFTYIVDGLIGQGSYGTSENIPASNLGHTFEIRIVDLRGNISNPSVESNVFPNPVIAINSIGGTLDSGNPVSVGFNGVDDLEQQTTEIFPLNTDATVTAHVFDNDYDWNGFFLSDAFYSNGTAVSGFNPMFYRQLIIPITNSLTDISELLEDGTYRFTLNANSILAEEEEVIFGCTDINALNYNPDATDDDGTCQYEGDEEEEEEGIITEVTLIRRNLNNNYPAWVRYGTYIEDTGTETQIDFIEFNDTMDSKQIRARAGEYEDGFFYEFEAWEITDGDAYVDISGDISQDVVTIVDTNNSGFSQSSPVITAYYRRFAEDDDDDDGSGGGGGTCFLEGTMITMADETIKPIEKIKVGDLVMSYDEHTKQIVNNKVVQTFFHPPDPKHISYGEYLIINNKMRVTTNHAILADTNGRSLYDWPLAKDLTINDYLFDKDLNKIKIHTIEFVSAIVDTYNFEVENSHTYIAENYIVHNVGGDGPGGGKGNLDDDYDNPPTIVTGNNPPG